MEGGYFTKGDTIASNDCTDDKRLPHLLTSPHILFVLIPFNAIFSLLCQNKWIMAVILDYKSPNYFCHTEEFRHP